jgi:putative urate catabolism protein
MRGPRDLIGYAGKPPHAAWPNKARIAVNFVLNYEEGAENSILNGDDASETFLSDIIGAAPVHGMRHVSMESLYDYGARAGFWRLHEFFTSRALPVTVFGVTLALQKNPEAVKVMLQAGWEIACHGYRWINYQNVPEAIERAHMRLAIDGHAAMTGARPLGWYTGRTSPNTAKLVAEDGNFLYDADSYADDLPYYDSTNGRPQLIMPYTLEANDMRFCAAQGFNTADHFFAYLKDGFDTLYAEGAAAPKMMSIGLHCRIIGRPSRLAALRRFCDYIAGFENVWVATRLDIAAHWLHTHPP